MVVVVDLNHPNPLQLLLLLLTVGTLVGTATGMFPGEAAETVRP